MAPAIGKDDTKAIAMLFSARLVDPVRVILFTKRGDVHCSEAQELLEEIRSIGRVRLEVVDIEREPAKAKDLGVELVPTTVIAGAEGAMVHYVGVPVGRQLRPLVEDLIDASRGKPHLEDGAKEAIAKVVKPTAIKVFVTPACPYSPSVVRSAHKFALANPLIRAFMVETLEFPEAAARYGVVGVPRTVINERFAFDGSPGEKPFAEKVLEMSQSA